MKPIDAKAKLEDQGISIKDWATKNGFPLPIVYAVLNGHLKGKRGVSHKVMVELGLKPKPLNKLV